MVRGVIFDLDGTLLDTLEDIAAVVNAVLLPRGYGEQGVQRIRSAVGMGVDVLSRRLLPQGTEETEVLTVAEEIRLEYLNRGSVLTRPYDGIPELLGRLADLGIPLAVLSNKPQLSTEEAIGRFFPDIPFRIVRGVLPGRPMKPDRGAVEDVLGALGTAPAETALVGDSDVDMLTAAGAGLIALGVSWGFRDRRVLSAHGASGIADSAAELLALLSARQQVR